MEEFWRNVDLEKLEIPKEIDEKKSCVIVNKGTKPILGVPMFYREVLPPEDVEPSPLSLLFFHGKWYDSKLWLDLETASILAACGHRVLAVDTPGFGNTPEFNVTDHAAYVDDIVHCFNLKNLVLISPSMGGFYVLPYLVKHWKNVAGLVTIASYGIEVLEQLPSAKDTVYKSKVYGPLQQYLYDPVPDLSHILTPTLVIFGEHDKTRLSALCALLPWSQCREILNGSHPAYLDNPPLWHRLLYNFLHCLADTAH